MKRFFHILPKRVLYPLLAFLVLGIGYLFCTSSSSPAQGSYPDLEAAHPSIIFSEHLFVTHLPEAQHRVAILDPTRQDTVARYLLVPRQDVEKVSPHPNERIIPIPVRRVVCLGLSTIGALEVLNKRASIVGIESVTKLYDNDLNERLRAGALDTLGRGKNINARKIKELDPDIILWSPLPGYPGAAVAPEGLADRVVLSYDIYERTPLGRAEWLKFIGLLMGKAKTADSLFSATASRYESLRLIAQDRSERPRVVFAQRVENGWQIPYPAGYADYLLHDANSKFVPLKGSIVGLTLSSQELLGRYRDAEYWLSWEIPGIQTLEQFGELDPEIRGIQAFRNGQVYLNTRLVDIQGGNEYWEQGWYHPDLILQDLVYILHSSLQAHGAVHNYWMQLQ